MISEYLGRVAAGFIKFGRREEMFRAVASQHVMTKNLSAGWNFCFRDIIQPRFPGSEGIFTLVQNTEGCRGDRDGSCPGFCCAEAPGRENQV